LSLFTSALYSQNTFPTALNTAVGIGTGTTAVSGAGGLRLKVTSGTAGNSGIQLTNVTSSTATVTGNNKALSVDATGKIILTPVVNTIPTITNIYNTDGVLSANRTVNMNAKNLTFNPSTPNSKFFINGTNGNVGVGTITPTTKLDVIGDVKATSGIFTNSLIGVQNFLTNEERVKKSTVISAGTLLDIPSGARTFNFMDLPASNFQSEPWSWFSIDDRNFSTRLRMIAKTGSGTEFELYNKNQQEIFRVIEDGNDKVELTLPKSNSFVGIGTTNFVDGTDTYRLAVKGAIRADRVKVYTTWADFVFEKNYILPTLEDVEMHIKENGHLKDIPSAKEVETNGIELGEMNKKLLQKIEELTLYIIEMNKELQEVKGKLKMN
jgi:hypothetical protein